MFSRIAMFLADNETITGNWTFSGTVTHSDAVSSTSTFASSGQDATRVYGSGSQSVGNAAFAALTFDSESYDRTAMHSVASNTERITIPTGAGAIYVFSAQATFTADATGFRKLALYKSGVKIAEVKEFSPHATETTVLHLTEQVSAAALDYYEIRAYQSSGGALDITAGEYVTFFTALRMW